MSRSEARKEFDPDTRIALLEGDTDDLETAVDGLAKGLQRLTIAAATTAITFGTSAVLLAANLVLVR